MAPLFPFAGSSDVMGREVENWARMAVGSAVAAGEGSFRVTSRSALVGMKGGAFKAAVGVKLVNKRLGRTVRSWPGDCVGVGFEAT